MLQLVFVVQFYNLMYNYAIKTIKWCILVQENSSILFSLKFTQLQFYNYTARICGCILYNVYTFMPWILSKNQTANLVE